MIGFLVRHKKLGLGKITDRNQHSLTIRFINGRTERLGSDVLRDRWVNRVLMDIGDECVTARGRCRISGISTISNDTKTPSSYEVTFDNGLRDNISEIDLIPSKKAVWNDVLNRFQSLSLDSLENFNARERFSKAYRKLLREGMGLRALLSSRIDLHAHQAYVAGRILLDPTRRYLLADEVGLGKTIEAGVVINDMLAQNPKANILVLCPSTLTRQWLCELYSKFGGRIFTLLDLGNRSYTTEQVRRCICSLTKATYEVRENLLKLKWDLVVVDEVHQLLAIPAAYDFVLELSKQVQSLLLLSALPAQQREDEFLRLMTLLEPARYDANSAINSDFETLFEAQSDIGLRLRLLSKRIEALANGENLAEERVRSFLPKILELPLVCDDAYVIEQVAKLQLEDSNLVSEVGELIKYVADNYRVNRRILRNRRQRLYEDGKLEPITRRLNLVFYDPDQIESDLLSAIDALVDDLRDDKKLSSDILGPFIRLVTQSLVTPYTALSFFEDLKEEPPGLLNERGKDFIVIGYMFGYQDWDILTGLVWKSVRKFLNERLLDRCIEYAKAWSNAWPKNGRFDALIKLIEKKFKTDKKNKLLIFVGYAGAAKELANLLGQKFGEKKVTSFYHELDDFSKEENARRFQIENETCLMVSDESGGEGRNFQFASEIVHFDTPWYAARVEQRIGRLDRLGREKYGKEVISNVIVARATREEGLVNCYARGLGVYENSVSGLEFALREVENKIATASIRYEDEEMADLVPSLAEIAKSERANDDREAVLDEASFEARGAEIFLKVNSSGNSTTELEESFRDYYKSISSSNSTRKINKKGVPHGVWGFFADDTSDPLPSLDKDGDGLFGEYQGTFHREVAQLRPDFQFFSVGNIFFDSVVRTLDDWTVGRTFAVASSIPNNPTSWMGIRFSFLPKYDALTVAGNSGLTNIASSIFTVNKKLVFVDLEKLIRADSKHAQELNQIFVKLNASNKDRYWWNLHKRHLQYLTDHFGKDQWSELIQNAYEIAKEESERHFKEKLGDGIQTEFRRIDEICRQLKRRTDKAAIFELTKLIALKQSLMNWNVYLDSAGFFSVNRITVN